VAQTVNLLALHSHSVSSTWLLILNLVASVLVACTPQQLACQLSCPIPARLCGHQIAASSLDCAASQPGYKVNIGEDHNSDAQRMACSFHTSPLITLLILRSSVNETCGTAGRDSRTPSAASAACASTLLPLGSKTAPGSAAAARSVLLRLECLRYLDHRMLGHQNLDPGQVHLAD